MRVLFLTEHYWPEARSSAYLFQSLAGELIQRGHEVVVLTKVPTSYVPDEETRSFATDEQLNGVQIIRVSGVRSSLLSIEGRMLDQFWVAARFCARAFRIKRPDVIVVYSPPLPLAMAAAVQCWGRRIPYVLHLHDLYPKTPIDLGMLKNRAVIWMARIAERIAYRKASRIVVPFVRSREILLRENSVAPTKIHLVPNWVDGDAFAGEVPGTDFRREHRLEKRFVVLYAGLMGFAQDLSPLIECARQMEHRTDIAFVFVGDGALANRWQDLCRGLSNVRFLPPVGNQRYTQALEGADVCVVPLSPELRSPAIPGKLQTIMAAARPVLAIVPPWNDTVELMRESNCGLTVTSGRSSDVKEALTRLYQDPSLRQELGQNGLRYAREHFALSAAVDEFEKVLAAAVRRPGALAKDIDVVHDEIL